MWKHNGVDTVLVSVTFTEEHVQMVRSIAGRIEHFYCKYIYI